jgi:hypothetical protein
MDATDRLDRIVASVQTLSATELEELFKILHANDCEYSRNNNGIFINLRWICDELLCKIEQFIAFCHKSRRELDKYENLRKELYATFQAAVRVSKARAREVGGVVVAAPDEEADAADAVVAPQEEVDVDAIDAEAEVPLSEGDRKAGRLASTMRFYLLKKKFAKPNVVMGSRVADVELRMEAYLM